LIAEKDNPQCDVFWSGDPIRANILKIKGISQSYDLFKTIQIQEKFKDKDFHWIGFSARARVLIYNTNLVKSEDAPKSIYDLIDPRWKGKFAIANPLFGTTSFQIAAIFVVLGDEKGKDFMEKMKENGVVIATSNGDVRRLVATGEVAFGLVDTDDACELIKDGKPIKMVFLDQDSIGNLIIPNTLSLIKNSPNHENGKKLINYLLTKEVEAKLAKSCAQMPLLPDAIEVTGVLSVEKIVPMKIDYDLTGKKLEEIQPYLEQWVKNR
jgi:iron(III) transport system substrate-binding protein